MSDISINTTQNVDINFKISPIGNRLAAYIIDTLIKFTYAYFAISYLANPVIRSAQTIDSWSEMAISIVFLFPAMIYTLTLETWMNGQTVGKKIMNIKVIKIDGYQMAFIDHLTRWIFRLVDFGISAGIIGFITIASTKKHQRLGDMASGTAVISLGKYMNIHHTILEEISKTYEPTYPDVIKFSDNDIRIIKETYLQAKKNNDYDTIQKLIKKIEEVSGIVPNESHEFFISKIIRDYNFYTGN